MIDIIWVLVILIVIVNVAGLLAIEWLSRKEIECLLREIDTNSNKEFIDLLNRNTKISEMNNRIVEFNKNLKLNKSLRLETKSLVSTYCNYRFSLFVASFKKIKIFHQEVE